MKTRYWTAYFRFSLPLMVVLGILNYLQRNHALRYPWIERALVAASLSFIVPLIYIFVMNMWRTQDSEWRVMGLKHEATRLQPEQSS